MEQAEKKKADKKTLAELIAFSFALLLLMGCGVVSMVQQEDLKKKDEKIAELTKKIEEKEEKTGDEPVLECEEELKPTLTGEEVLKLLKERVVELGYDYGILNANVIGKKNGEETYWVVYTATSGSGSANVIFSKGADGKWDFDIPGFTGYTDETTEGFKFDPAISGMKNN